MRRLLELSARRFGCLDDVVVPLSALNILVGPNGSGKSTLLDVVQFFGDTVRMDLAPSVQERGGMSALRFRGGKATRIELSVKAIVTKYASETAPDVYKLSFNMLGPAGPTFRSEEFFFKRYRGPGRRITISGNNISFGERREKLLKEGSLALSALPKLAVGDGAEQVAELAEFLAGLRVFRVDDRRARLPSPLGEFAGDAPPRLAADASNLSRFLAYLAAHEAEYGQLLEDARAMIPGFRDIEFVPVGGAEKGVVAQIQESWLPGSTPLARVSYGTVRSLAILAMLHDPSPPPITCVEEIDQGLHPHVFDRLVERLRKASKKTQFLISTHSPALVNRLRPEELIVCERDAETGGAIIPAISVDEIHQIFERLGDGEGPRLGELWFSGALGGGLP